MSAARIRQRPAGRRPDVSVVVVHWNTPQLLRACILSMRDGLRDVESEVIVVDNGSDKDLRPPLWPAPGLQVIHLEENRGFAAAANRGAMRARGRLVLFVNSDVELTPHSAARLTRALDGDSRLAAVAAAARDRQGNDRDPAMRFLTPLNQAAGLLGLGGRAARAERADASGATARSVRTVPWARASTMLVRRDAFVAVGGFDEGFFFYEEDEDLCWRLRRRGYRIGVVDAVRVRDVGGASTALAGDWPALELYRGQLRFVRRRFGRSGALLYRMTVSVALAAKLLAGRARREQRLVLKSIWTLPRALSTKAA
jgi:GT2 family glycosyltransferase